MKESQLQFLRLHQQGYKQATSGDLAAAIVATSLELAAMDTKMRILIKLGRESEAQQVARMALAKDPNHPDFQDVVKQRWCLDVAERVDSSAPPSGTAPVPY